MFDEQTLDLILKGKKTQTRRLRNDDNRPAVPGNIHKLKIDRTSKTYGYIEIISCEKAVFGDITETDAHKEGFKNVKEYTKYFTSVNGEVKKSTPIWVINFKLVNVKTKYIIQVIKNYVIKKVKVEDKVKSYFHKPHLGSLPHDRRSTNPKELQERIDEIDRRIDENNDKLELANREKDRITSLIETQQEDIKKAEKENEKLKDEVRKDFEQCINDLSNVENEWDDYMKDIESAKDSDEEYEADFDNIYDVGSNVSTTLGFYGNFFYVKDGEDYYDVANTCFTGNNIYGELDETDDDMGWCQEESSEVTNTNISIQDTVYTTKDINDNLIKIDNNEIDIETLEESIKQDQEKLKGYEKEISKIEKENKDYVDERKRTSDKKEQVEKNE